MAADLITQDEFLASTGQSLADLDATTGPPQVASAISAASSAVRAYCDRDFTLSSDAVQAPRQFRYEGNSVLDIDDATSVSAVSIISSPLNIARTLDASEWFASAVENPNGVLDQVELYTVLPWGRSPAMGFTQNMDQYPYRGAYPLIIEVTAVWGWPEIPIGVKQACTIAANFNVVQSDPSAISSEAIAGYSRSFNNPRQNSIQAFMQQIPLQAIAYLDPYVRWPI